MDLPFCEKCSTIDSDRYSLIFALITESERSLIVGEPKSHIVQKHTFFAPERYTAGILYSDSLKSARYETTV